MFRLGICIKTVILLTPLVHYRPARVCQAGKGRGDAEPSGSAQQQQQRPAARDQPASYGGRPGGREQPPEGAQRSQVKAPGGGSQARGHLRADPRGGEKGWKGHSSREVEIEHVYVCVMLTLVIIISHSSFHNFADHVPENF